MSLHKCRFKRIDWVVVALSEVENNCFDVDVEVLVQKQTSFCAIVVNLDSDCVRRLSEILDLEFFSELGDHLVFCILWTGCNQNVVDHECQKHIHLVTDDKEEARIILRLLEVNFLDRFEP